MKDHSDVAQLVRASDSYPEGRQFNSARRYQIESFIKMSNKNYFPDKQK